MAAAALGVARERGLATVRHLGHSPNWFDPEPPAADDRARSALAAALLRQPGDVLLLEELAADGPMVATLSALRPELEIIPGPATFRVRSAAVGARSGSRRREAGRLARRAADRGTPLGVRAFAEWRAIAPQVPELLALQAAAWEGRPADPFTGTPEGRAFVARALAAMGAESRVRLVRVEVGDRLAAFHLSVVWGTRAVVYKTAFDRGHGLPGLGWASLLATLDHLASEGVRSVDLGPWGDAYKAHIADAQPIVDVRVGLSAIGRAYLRAAAAKNRVAGRAARVPA